ncbi:MAG: FG-GAP repeat domain-containing protein, partial [Planctomycetia bacterium]
MFSNSWIRKIFSKSFSSTAKENKKKNSSIQIQLQPLEDRLVPAVPFSPAFPHALSINAPGSAVTNSASFTVTFNQPVIGVDAADFQLVNTGTVANGTIASVTGSGTTYTVNVTGITGSGTLGVNLVGQPSITALPSFAAQTPVPTGNDPRSVTLGDVNRDGILDIVTANFSLNQDTVSVLLGNGDGTFKAQSTFTVGSGASSVALGDVNGDGRLDIITANFKSNKAGVLLNTTTAGATTASFSSPTAFTTRDRPTSVTLGDVNGDGRLDIITASAAYSEVSVLLG